MPSETPKLDELLKDSPYFTKVSREMFAVARAELAALRERVRHLEASLKQSHENDWTGSICDRLNSLVRENADLFIECTDGPSAAMLVGGIHGAFNNLRGQVRGLKSDVKHARNAALDEAIIRAKCIRDNKIVCGEHTVAEAVSFVIDSINNLKGA